MNEKNGNLEKKFQDIMFFLTWAMLGKVPVTLKHSFFSPHLAQVSKEPFSFLYHLICLIGIIVLEFLTRDQRLDNMQSSVKMHFERSFINVAAFKGPIDVLLLAAEAGLAPASAVTKPHALFQHLTTQAGKNRRKVEASNAVAFWCFSN